MNDSELRILFAAFAMLKVDWSSADKDDKNARDCFAIADAMVEASRPSPPEDALGIVAIKKRRTKGSE